MRNNIVDPSELSKIGNFSKDEQFSAIPKIN